MISVHSLVKNESRYVWFAVIGVIDYVDRVLLWDTGSTDGTEQILKEIKKLFPSKVDLRFLGDVNVDEFTLVRQKMLDATESDWFLVVDGDEIWWQDSIRKLVAEITANGECLDSIVVPTINLVGDIYHHQESAAGNYFLAGRKGHYSLRAVNRRIPGLASANPHGTWGWIDSRGKMIQDREPKRIKFLDAPYLHASFLPRSADWIADKLVPKRKGKLKHEIGMEFPGDFYYPEVLFLPRPSLVPSPWERMSHPFYLRSLIETPLRKIKRRILPARVGY